MTNLRSRTAHEQADRRPHMAREVGTLRIGGDGRIEFCDPAAARMFHSAASHLVSKFVATFVPDLDRQAWAWRSSPGKPGRVGRCVAWHPCQGTDEDGKVVPLEALSLSSSCAFAANAMWLMLRRTDTDHGVGD